MINVNIFLKEKRLEKGLTRKELAEKAGVNYITICSIENQKLTPTALTIYKLAKVLECEEEVEKFL